jgi:hypothetical protein
MLEVLQLILPMTENCFLLVVLLKVLPVLMKLHALHLTLTQRLQAFSPLPVEVLAVAVDPRLSLL